MMYKNKKSGKLYKQIAIGEDTTNWRDVISVVYCPCDNEQSIYIRDEMEFYEEFDTVELMSN